MQTKKGIGVVLLMVLISALTLSVFGYAKETTALPYKIGVNVELTGTFAMLGEPAMEGMKVRVEEINRRGGINGHLLELIIVDNKSDSNNAVLSVKRLVGADEVHVVIAGLVTMINLAVIPIVTDAQCPTIGISGTTAPDRPAKKWYFRPCKVELSGFLGCDEFLKGYGVKKVGVLYQGGPHGQATMAITPPWLEEHGYKLVASESYNPGDTDMTPQLSKIASAKPDALFVFGADLAGGLGVKQAREMNLKYPIWVSVTLSEPTILKMVGKYYEMQPPVQGSVERAVVYDQLPDSTPDKILLGELVNLYSKSKYGQKRSGQPMPSTFCGGYMAIQLLEDALKRSKADPAKLQESRAAIRDALEQTKNFMVAGSKFTMSPQDHCGLHYGTDVMPCNFKNGKPVALADLAARLYDTKPPRLWYPWEWESLTKPKEPKVR